MTNETEMINLEAKVQTIFYTTPNGDMNKHHHVGNERLNMKQAVQILTDEGIVSTIILRTVTQRITIRLTKEELQERIVQAENFYQKQDNQ